MAGACQFSVSRQVFDDSVSENLPPAYFVGLDKLGLDRPLFIAPEIYRTVTPPLGKQWESSTTERNSHFGNSPKKPPNCLKT